MELTGLELATIKRALEFLIQEKPNARNKETVESARRAVTDILNMYPDSSGYEIKPDELEDEE